MVRFFVLVVGVLCLGSSQAYGQYGFGSFRNANIIARSGGIGNVQPASWAANANIIARSGGIDPLSVVPVGAQVFSGTRFQGGQTYYAGGGYHNSGTPSYHNGGGHYHSNGNPYGTAYTGSVAPSDLGLPGTALYQHPAYRVVTNPQAAPNPTPSSMGLGLPGEQVYRDLGMVSGQGGYVNRPINQGRYVPSTQVQHSQRVVYYYGR
jgi:hypothetical protein